jgi:hypothetical protein
MPRSKEFTVHVQDRPGTLGSFCRALADSGVNILAFHSSAGEIHMVVDDFATAKTVMDARRTAYIEAEIAQVKLAHRPGELARVTSLLGDANINVNYAYVGVEPGTSAILAFFGVADVTRAVAILDENVSKAA